MQMIYLDNAATTKPLPGIKDVYSEYAQSLWQNPSALYAPATEVQRRMDEARTVLLNAFGGTGHKCFFTGGGTEGANTVVLRGARLKKGMNYVCGGAEHPCVEESFKWLEGQGYPVTWVRPDAHGVVSAEDVAGAVDESTALVSVMHVNNETGAKNDIAGIAARVKAKNPQTLFYSDGVQAFLRENAVDTSNIDYYTVSAHKVHAIKGAGAVFCGKSTPLKPFLLGGGQEYTLRSGTQNTLGAFCFEKSADYFMQEGTRVGETLEALRQAFIGALDGVEEMHLITPAERERRCSHIVNVAFEGVNGETLLHALEAKGIYISTGSACSSKKGKSRIAKALGMREEVAAGAVRVSFSPFNTEDEAIAAAAEMKKNIAQLRRFMRK
ncbi:cysteine desulfurase [Christensenellaceae bacterium OttesenSCG-928-K19]|nr:cysteine desulfurase [Christensenellaceae bacterium OttesenSCG-928-K19]